MRNHLTRALFWPPAIVLAAFGVRICLMIIYQGEMPLLRRGYAPFGYETGRVARAIAAGEGFSSPLNVDTGPTAWFTPVYPYLLAGIFKIFGIYSMSSRLVIQALNCAFSAFVCWPILAIGRRLFGSAIGGWSAWVWAFYPPAVTFPVEWVWDTSLSALLLALIFLATLEVRSSPRAGHWAGYGALWVLGVLTNPSFLSVLPFLLAWLGLQARKQGMRWPRLVGAVTLVFLLGVTPWIARNYLVFGKFIPLRSNFGLELWLGNNDQVPDSWTPLLHPNDNDEERERFRQLGEIAYMEEKQREAVQFIKTHPADFTRFLWHRFANNWLGVWDPVADIWPHAPWNFKGLIVVNCLFSSLSFLGLLFAFRARKPEAKPLAVLLLVFPLVYIVTHTALRYRHPIDPVMSILAVYAVAYPLARLAQKPAVMPARAARGQARETS